MTPALASTTSYWVRVSNTFGSADSDAATLTVRGGPGDFNGDGSGDIAVYRPSTGQWFIRNQASGQFGDPGDIPVPGDYNGDRVEDIAVFRPSTGQWFVRNQFTVQFGDRGDVAVPGDFNGDGVTDVAVYRPSTGQWFVRNQFSVNFGGPGTCADCRRLQRRRDRRCGGLPAVNGHVVRAKSAERAVRHPGRPAGAR